MPSTTTQASAVTCARCGATLLLHVHDPNGDPVRLECPKCRTTLNLTSPKTTAKNRNLATSLQKEWDILDPKRKTTAGHTAQARIDAINAEIADYPRRCATFFQSPKAKPPL
jgi:ribosomal protein S27AE